MSEDLQNKRKHIRYVDPDSKPIRLRYRWAGEKEIAFYALVADESFSGLGCIYIGHAPCDLEDSIVWIESQEIETMCKVARCYNIENNIYFLGLTITDVK